MRKLAVAFVIGGIFTLLILLLLQGLGQSEAGMSDGAGTVSPSRPSDTEIIFVICGYFFISAFGISVSITKSAVWLWAALAHALLVIGYIMIFVSAKNGDPDGYVWPGEVRKLALVMAAYFSPWLIVWGIVLLSKQREGIPFSE